MPDNEPVEHIPDPALEVPCSTDWTPPTELDEYHLIRPLGHGGMGSVWLAEDRLLHRLVAVKFIAHAKPDQQTRDRFAIEARAAARLQHINVVTVHRYGELSGRPYLVSEYIRGESLDKLAKPVSWKRSLELGIALARGLAAAHRHGIVHRDIKPANAILTIDGDAKLVDFGLARLDLYEEPATDARLSVSSGSAAGLTAPGAVAGTPRYLAPEVRRGEPASRRSDVYQIGCILYELVVGRAPIMDLRRDDDSTHDADVASLADGSGHHRGRIIAHDELELPSLVERLGGLGARFAAVVDRCLCRDPQQRFSSGDELREALEQVQAPAQGGELPGGNPYRGLVPFDAEHRALFFGRGADVRSVIERLRTDAFVLITGDSGVGKSSLCRAGVLPQIADGAFGDGVQWTVVQLLPGHRPLTNLGSVLADRFGLDEASLAATLRDEPARLARELRRARHGIVVFVDQIEELCTIADRAEAVAFAAVLAELSAGTPGLRLLATVRSDFLTRIAELPQIGAEIGRAIYLLRPLSAEGARDAVVGPARAKGARFESEELVETLVASVADGGTGAAGASDTDSTIRGSDGRPVIELPLLAFTLAQLWEARDQSTQTISAGSLEAIGGVRGALARHADGVLDSLLPHQRAGARKLLLRLVTAERTRVRRTADELSGLDRAALDALVRGRLVVARGNDAPTFELAHERLIDGWPTLAGWLSETTEAIAAHARLATAARDWERLERAKDGLWGARQLSDLALLVHDDLTASEAHFASASRRAVSRRRWTRGSIAIAIPFMMLAFYVGARLVTRRDLDRHIAGNVAEADRYLGGARRESDASAKLRIDAFAHFDAGDLERGEASWEAARQRSTEAQAEYVQAAGALEAAFLLDTDRDAVRRELAEVTYERLQLADREYRTSDRNELAARLGLYDDGGDLASRLTAPARLIAAIEPASSTISIVAASATSDTPLVPSGTSLSPGSYVLIARADGRATVRLPILLRPGELHRIAFELPPAAAVPAGFVYVPSGGFLYGSRDDELIRRFFGAVPMHETRTEGFLIGRTEVTYAEWIEFLDGLPLDERVRRTPLIENSTTVQTGGALELRPVREGWELHITPASVAYESRTGASIEYRDRPTRRRQDWLRFPVSGISPDDTLAYTAWLDRTGRVKRARLCTETEWERATRGVDGRPYPQGDWLAPDDANIDATYGRREGGFGPDEVGSHPASTSPFGLVDASGNVWEITRSRSGTDLVLRGGSFYTDATSAHLANRQGIPPVFRHLLAGLRVCADAP